jgi:hypothetical protein
MRRTIPLLLLACHHPADPATPAPTVIAVGAQPVDIAAGDLDGDGRLDLVTTRDTGFGGLVAVALGNGDGSFGPVTETALRGQPRGLAVGDVTGDGIADIVVVSETFYEVAVLAGAGDGSFDEPLFYALAGDPSGVILADLDGDGFLDILVPIPGVGVVSVLLSLAQAFGT